ncbi:ABC-2 type transporter [Acidimicrobium ferrooxidans DSM 10331]|uniref:Transport permease protein n=1 Tax=Acidimicrobium ferrooxidans (strain DSM 10331 / JCM 15462 / NBRC 103882 / ICP) TaxID=525909 RepID=C7M106_ACIFD|nr:ABC-2 type transporter [Acidimicrobium ferrooxidans DSM 10331]
MDTHLPASQPGDTKRYDPNRALAIRLVRPRVSVTERLANIWRYRDLLRGLIVKEIRVKYKDSFLGFLWSLVNPAMFILIYYIVFQKVLGSGIPLFAIFLATGLLCWNLFQTGIMGATGAVVDNAGLVKKVAFPREILALASVGSASVFFVFQAVVLAVFLVVFQVVPSVSYLWVALIGLVALLVFASGLGILVSGITVYLRDVRHLMEILLQAWFWATPVVYAFELVANKFADHHIPVWVYLLNPVTPVVLAFQRTFYAKTDPYSVASHTVVQILPTAGPMWYFWGVLGVLVAGVVLFVVALWAFGRLEGNFAEEL